MNIAFKILMTIGVLLLCLAGYLGNYQYQFQKEAIHTMGIVTDLYGTRKSNSTSNPTWYPTVTFTDNEGKEVTFISSFGSSSYRNSMGKPIEVVYLAGDSENAKLNDGGYFLPIFIAAFGVVLSLLGFAFNRLMNGGSKYRRLVNEGKQIMAKIDSIEQNRAIQINGRSPWRIVCQWMDPQTGQIHLFNSPNFSYDPSRYATDENMTVYIDPDNYKKYYVDVSKFPKKA